MTLADLDVLIRWTDHSVGLTGWGWILALILAASISDIGNKK